MLNLLLAAADQPPPQTEPPWFNMLPFLIMIPVGYLLLFRPAQKQEQDRKRMLGALKVKDRVQTAGGFIGVVTSIKREENEVVLKPDDGSKEKLRFTMESIVRVYADDAPKEPPK